MPTGTCKLCRAVRPLCRSHIVPDFAYDLIKNDKGQILSVGRTVKPVQTGYWEHLLCQECEGTVNRYETEFKKTWMDTVPNEFNTLKSGPLENVITVDVPNYDLFKLFHLSVFWRAAVSTGFKIDGISFGPYERRIANMLQCGNSGQPGDFPCLGYLNLDGNRRADSAITPLAKGEGRFETYQYYLMSYAFCDWVFVVAQPGPRSLVDLEIKCRTDRKCLLLTMPYTQSKSFILWADILRQLRR